MLGRTLRFPVAMIPLLAATLLASCDIGNPTGPRILRLVYVSGNHQVASVGATLSDPFVVRTQDQNGVPVPGVTLNWEIISGGGSFVVASATTDESGLASAAFRLGNTLGTQTVSVRTGSQPPILFTLQGIPAPASQLRIQAGDGQTGLAGAELAAPIAVIVTDDLQNPKAGIPVTFAVASGGGTVSTANAVTNAQGIASVVWTLGPSVGAQTVVATSTGLPAATFVATATAPPAP